MNIGNTFKSQQDNYWKHLFQHSIVIPTLPFIFIVSLSFLISFQDRQSVNKKVLKAKGYKTESRRLCKEKQ